MTKFDDFHEYRELLESRPNRTIHLARQQHCVIAAFNTRAEALTYCDEYNKVPTRDVFGRLLEAKYEPVTYFDCDPSNALVNDATCKLLKKMAGG